MRQTSLRELHINTSQLVREAEQGGVIVIERRGVPVAELRPISSVPRLSKARLARLFTDMETNLWSKEARPMTDSTTMIEEDRNR